MCIIKKTEHGFQNIFASKWTSFSCTCHEVFQVPSQKWMVHLQEAGNMCSVGSRPHQPYISLPLLAWSLELLNLAPSWVPHTHLDSHSELLGCIDQGPRFLVKCSVYQADTVDVFVELADWLVRPKPQHNCFLKTLKEKHFGTVMENHKLLPLLN